MPKKSARAFWRNLFRGPAMAESLVPLIHERRTALGESSWQNPAWRTMDLAGVFAVCTAAAERVFGLKMFDVQLEGALALTSGKIAEMQTGEGKTLAAVPAVARSYQSTSWPDRDCTTDLSSSLSSSRDLLRHHADQVRGALLVSHPGDVPVSISSHVRDHRLGGFGCRRFSGPNQEARFEDPIGRAHHDSAQDLGAWRSLCSGWHHFRTRLGTHGCMSWTPLRAGGKWHHGDDRRHWQRVSWDLVVRVAEASTPTLIRI